MGYTCLGWLGGRLSFDGRRAVCWLLLSEIWAADSGTGPIHQERMRRSRFSGPCPSDVKSAGHPEPGFPIPLSSSTAALCAAGETQKNPSAGSIPGHRPGSQPQPADIPTPEEEHPGSREVSISCLLYTSLKPLDEDLVLKSAKKTKAVVTAENHSVIGALGGAVSEFLSGTFPVPVIRVGVQDHFGEVGFTGFLQEKYGLTKKEIVAAAKQAIQIRREQA